MLQEVHGLGLRSGKSTGVNAWPPAADGQCEAFQEYLLRWETCPARRQT